METIHLALYTMTVNQFLALHRSTPMVVLIMTMMAMQIWMMPATTTTVLLGSTEKDVTIMTKMAGQITNSITLMEMFSSSTGNSL